MPSFLHKVFGRKKDDKEAPRRVADTELLDGKFESVSPSATKFPEVANERQPRYKEKDSPFNVFRSKSRPSSPESRDRRPEVPHLSLNLPGLRDEEASRELGVVFDADPESQLLSEEAIGRRRLNPLETLILVRACSEAIIARGLESLGIMHPHWHSASPEEQRKLISLFLKSLAPKGSIITLSTTPSTIATAFNSEISSTKSPYDVAAVLRWGLRHLQLEGTSFGQGDNWYKTFFDAERSAGWPPNGYSSTLSPLLPTSHLELLTATLELFSSIAAHAEANGISGSKLSKFFGLWLLAVERVQKDDDWSTFYARWERTGRMLEHLFLSRIRDDAIESRMPTRLLELIQRYPYQTDPNADLLARPRFSTIQYDALFVRIETELSATADQPSHHPLRIISEAFKAEASFDAGEHVALWESIRKSGAVGGSSSSGEHPELSHIFADETLRFFSLVPIATGSSVIGSPSVNLTSSLGDKDAATTAAAAGSSPPRHPKTPTSPISPSDVTSPIGPDWITFSTSGFLDDSVERPPLASTLMEKERDMEVTIPRPSSPRLTLFNSRKSSDRPRTPAKSEVPKPSPASTVLSPVKTVSKSTHVSLVQLDEAFVDFWSDALLDPISSSWPAFIICKLKNVATGVDGKRVEWLIVEQAFKRPPPPTPEASTSSHVSHESPSRTRTSSPNSSTSDSSFVFGSMFKRFGLLTSPAKKAALLPQGTKKGKGKGKERVIGLMVGEMGEILREEDEGKEKNKSKKEKEKKDETVRVRVPSPKPKKSVEASRYSVIAAVKKSVDEGSRTNGVVVGSLATGAAVAVGGAAAVAIAGKSEVDKAEEPAPVLAKESTTSGAPVENVASTVPQEVPAPEPVKEAIPREGTVNETAVAQKDEAPSTVAGVAEPRVLSVADSVQSEVLGHLPVVSEPEAAQTVVEQVKAVEAEAEVVSVPAAEEVKSTEHVAAPVVETMKEPEANTAPATEETQVPEHEAAPVVEDTEPEVVPHVEDKVLHPQAVVEEVKVPEPEVAPVVEEAKAVETIGETKPTEPEFVPAVKEAKVPESETAPVIEEVEALEDKRASAVQDVKAPESVVEAQVSVPVVEEVKASGHVHDAEPFELEVAPVVEEVNVPEPEVVPVHAETKAFEPEVVPTVDEVKTRELEVAPMAEEIKAPEHEAAPVAEEIKSAEVLPVTEEAKASQLEDVPTVEEAKVPEHEVAPPCEEEVVPAADEAKPREIAVAPIVEETKVVEHEVVPVAQEIKTAEVEPAPAAKEITASELEVVPTLEEVKVPEAEIVPVVEENKAEAEAVEVTPTEHEVASIVDHTKVPGPMEETVTEPELTPVVGEGKASVIPEAQEEVANETTTKDLHDEQREIEPEAVIAAKELLAEPIVKAEAPESEPVVVEQSTPIERALEPDAEVLPIEKKSESAEEKMIVLAVEDVAEPVVKETNESVAVEVNEPIARVTAESATKPVVEETTELATEPVVGEAVQPVITEVHEIGAQAAAEPVVEKTFEKTFETAEVPVIEEPVQPLVPESHRPTVEESVEPVKQPVIEESVQPFVPEYQQPIVAEHSEQPGVEETLESATPPAVEEAVQTLVEETHEPLEEVAVPVARVTAEPVVEKISESEPDKNATDDKVVEPQKIFANEEVPTEKHVDGSLVEGGSRPAEAVVIKEEASPEVPNTEVVKTSIEEAPSPISANEEKSMPVAESVAKEPGNAVVEEEVSSVTKESAEVSTAAITEAMTSEEAKDRHALATPVPENDGEDVATPTIEVAPVVEKPSSSVSDSRAAPMPVELVTKEESALIEPDVVHDKEETALQVAFEDVKTAQEKSTAEGTIPSASETVPPAVESTIGRTLKPVTIPTVEEHAPVVEEPVAAVIESASVVGLGKVEPPAVEEAVSEQSAPAVEDITESAAPAREVETTAEFEAERFTRVNSTASDNPAAGSAGTVETENAATKEFTPVIEEPAPSAKRSEDAAEPTEQISAPTQEEVVTPGAEEHNVSVAEPDHKLETYAPVEPVQYTDLAQEETTVLGPEGSSEVHAQIKEVAPAVEEPTSTTVEPAVEAKVVSVSTELEPVLVEKSSDVINSKELLPLTKEAQPVVVDSSLSAADHGTSTRTEDVLVGTEEPNPSAAVEHEPKMKAEPVPTPTIEDSTPIVKEPALSVPVEPPESTDVVEPKEETCVPRQEVAPVIEEPAPSAEEPETGVLGTEVESSLPIADEPVKKSAENAEILEETPAPATEEVAAIVEECTPSVNAPAAPAEAEVVLVETGHSAKESSDEYPVLISIEKEVVPIVEQPQAGANLVPVEVQLMLTENDTETTPVPLEAPAIEEPAPANVVESEPKPEAHHPSASNADKPMEEGIVVDNSSGASAPTEIATIVKEPASSPLAAAETKPIPVAQDEPNQEGALPIHAADETSIPTAKEVNVNVAEELLAEEPMISATEPRAQAEVPAHTDTNPTQTVEEKVPIVDSKDEISAPIVEVAAEHLVPKQASVPSQVDAPATTEEPVQKPSLIDTTADTSVPIAEEATSIFEEHTTNVDREPAAFDIVVPNRTTDEPVNESSAIAVESIAASAPVPITEDVLAPLADEVKPLAVESEHGVETPAPVTVEPILAIIGESAKESVPIVEHAPNTKVSEEEVPIVKKDTVPVEATIVDERAAKMEVSPPVQDITEIPNSVHETSNKLVSKDDAIVVAENGNGHSAAVKEETTISEEVPVTSATAAAKD